MMGGAFDLLGAIAAGIGMAALLFAAMHALRKLGYSPARWILPAGIGLTMIGYSIWNDYTWLGRAQAKLSESTELLAVGRESYLWAPWTYPAPVAIRFAALDTLSIGDTDEGTKRAEIMLVERRGQTLLVPQEFDCEAGRIRPADGAWKEVAEDDAAFGIVCGEG